MTQKILVIDNCRECHLCEYIGNAKRRCIKTGTVLPYTADRFPDDCPLQDVAY